MGCVQSRRTNILPEAKTKSKNKTKFKKRLRKNLTKISPNRNMIIKSHNSSLDSFEHNSENAMDALTNSSCEKINPNSCMEIASNIEKRELFKNDLNDLENKIKKLDYEINNGVDIIYEYCNELIRIIQLSKEKQIIEIKTKNNIDVDIEENDLEFDLQTKIQSVHDSHEILIEKIEKYEHDSKRFYLNNMINGTDLTREINKIKIFVNFFVNQWKNHLYEYDLKELKKACNKLIDTQKILNELIKETHLFIFNNEILEIKATTSIFINSKQYINLKKANTFSLNLTNNDCSASFARFELFNNGVYLLTYRIKDKKSDDYQRGNTAVITYDPFKKKITNKKVMLNSFVSSLKRGDNQVAMSYSSQNSHFIVVINKDLNILYKIDSKSTNLIASNELFLYCSDFFNYDRLVNKSYDWELKKIEPNLKLQLAEPTEPFYIESRPSSVCQLETTTQRYFVSFFSEDNERKLIIIFNNVGVLLNTISADKHSKFKIDSNENLIVLDESRTKLKYFDSNGVLIREAELILAKNTVKHVSNLKFLIDKNNQIHFLNTFNLNVYKI